MKIGFNAIAFGGGSINFIAATIDLRFADRPTFLGKFFGKCLLAFQPETGPDLQVIAPVADAGTDAKAIAPKAASERGVNKRIIMLLLK